MQARTRQAGTSFSTFGGRVPALVGILIAVTAIVSVAGRMSPPLAAAGVLVAERVWSGELWRLVTWVFFELDSPISLVFACLMLYWFGRDLCQQWGPRRFLAVYLGFPLVVGGITSLLALAWPALRTTPFYGTWPLAEALVIAWATLHPDRQILAYFVFPIGGRKLIYLTVGGTVLFALYDGFLHFLPHFLSEGLMLAYLHVPSLRGRWLKRRLDTLERELRRKQSHLHVVKDDARTPPRTWLN